VRRALRWGNQGFPALRASWIDVKMAAGTAETQTTSPRSAASMSRRSFCRLEKRTASSPTSSAPAS